MTHPKNVPPRKSVGRLFGQAFSKWRNDNAPLLAAGLSYYTVFSLIPLAMLAVAIVGIVLDEAAAHGVVSLHLQGLTGREVAEAIEGLVENAGSTGGKATLLSIFLLLFGASGIFVQLQTALNVIWRVDTPPISKGILHEATDLVRKRLVSFGMVLAIGLLLIVAFFVQSGLALVQGYFADVGFLGNVALWEFLSLALSFLLLMIMTAFVYQFLPDTDIPWSDVWIGASLTSLMLAVGRYLIGLYFRLSDVGSVYGVAGSFVLVMVGVYLSAQIFLFGAEFTWVYARDRGSRAPGARTSDARAERETPVARETAAGRPA